MNDLVEPFVAEARELIQAATDDLLALEAAPGDGAAVNRVFRGFHTLKGSVGLFDWPPLLAVLHAAEESLSAARAGARAVDPGLIDLCLETLDAVARCTEAIAGSGDLPAGFSGEAARLVARHGGPSAPPEPGPASAPEAGPVPDWATAFAAASGDAAAGLARVAVRYRPRADCFFAGDDPLGLVRRLPGLTALDLAPAEPWPAPDLADVFACNLVVTLLTTDSREAVDEVFRLVRDQATIVTLPAASAAAPSDEPAGEPAAAPRSLRVDAARIDDLAALVGELVVARNGLAHLAARAGEAGAEAGFARALRETDARLGRLAGALHREVGALRLLPLERIFRRFARPVREIARGLGKEVALTTAGGGTGADRAVVEGLFEPLLHVIRNAVDHGIEPAGERRRAGKPEAGRIALTAERRGGTITVSVADDGRGIDPERVRRRARERGLLPPERLAAMDEAALLDLIFAPGFSTAERVGDLSGRGVGLDAVRTALARLGGRVAVETRAGAGTTFRLVLPPTVALSRLLLVEAGGETYGLPIEAVTGIVRVARDRLSALGSGRATILRGRTVPVIGLAARLGLPAGAPAADATLVVLAGGIAVEVERVRGHLDTAVRPPSGLLAALPDVAGTTVLGDGRVLVVLDPSALEEGER
ncbi:chemotaxis protein CheA [Methylobacterium oryzihabitans]|uniref:Chemotaxis protein CheA n=1 Tax=Methylobacterium oryzihabitans TaxID=2499852 RepID=A0A437PI92_9HYPH|nr:chemotaxis protein CheA [Methylobacterium oryzihabitans]RVU21937.1 chemotaxis protein CheA [Methylobacterium oryzihabitans]